MVYAYECSLETQNCPTLYPDFPTDLHSPHLPFSNLSCVRDARLEGNVGRCGFPGAACNININGTDNCAGGNSSIPLCKEDICGGKVGTPCDTNTHCNWGIRCNGNYSFCGGANAYLHDEERQDGLDVAKDYCISGEMYLDSSDETYRCQAGPKTLDTVPPPPDDGAPKGLIAGVSAAGVTITLVIIAFILWWKHQQVVIVWWKRRQNRSRMIPVKTYEEHYSNSNGGKISSSTSPTAGNPFFSNDMISPSRSVFPPEIQSGSEDNGNFSIRHITTLASLEKGSTIMDRQARQGPGQGTASNTNYGFYGPTAIKTKPSSKQPELYEMTNVLSDQGILRQ